MYKRECPECGGWGTSGRLIMFGGVGAHVTGTCPTCNGKCYVREGWVAHFARLKAEKEARGRENLDRK